MREHFDKLDNYESRFSEKVWAGVSNHLEVQRQKKRKRRILLLGLTSVMMLTTVVGYYSLVDLPDAQVASVDVVTDISHVGSKTDTDPLGTDVNEMMVNNSAGSNTLVSERLLNDYTTQLSTDQIIQEQDQVFQVQSLVDVERDPSLEDIVGDRVDSVTQLANTFTLSEPTQAQPDVETSTSNIVNNLSEGLSVSKGQTAVVSSPHKAQFASNRQIQPLDFIQRQNTLKSAESATALFVKEGCDLLRASPFKSYAWTQLSVFTPISIHTAKADSAEDYSTVRQSTEKALLSPEFGFGIGVKSKNGYFLESGFQVALYRERLGYVDPETVKTQTVITIDSVNVGGMLQVTADTTIVQIPGSREVVNYNTHQTVSIPLIVGFDKYIGSSLSIGGKIGTIFNLFKESEGRILDEDMVIRDIVHDEGANVNVYKTRMSTQLLVGSQLRYHFSPQLDVYVSADVRFTPQSITIDDYSLRQRFTSPVLGAGMRYYF